MSRLSASEPHRSSLRRRLRPRDNAATLLRGARACVALLAAATLLALAAPAQAQTEVWTATLTPADLSASAPSAAPTASTPRDAAAPPSSPKTASTTTPPTTTSPCSSSAPTESLDFEVDADITTATAALTLVVGSTSLVLADADTITARSRIWDSSGVSLTAGTDITVKLTAASTNTAPTAADKTLTTGEDSAYAFEADDFGFADTDTGDTLASVRIVTLPGVGSLTYDGTAVTANLAVTKADIDASKLVFTPVTGGSGTPYTTFTFKVNDGTVDSDSAYTMTVNVTPANNAAMGAPTIAGTAQLGQTLTAATTGITDADGLTSPMYEYQWIRVNGTDANISGANSNTYTLVDADLGKTIKVRVTFADDGANTETLTSEPTAPVAAAGTAACAVPALSGRNVIWTSSMTVAVDPDKAGAFGYESGSFGSLDDQTFTVRANEYTIGLVSLRRPVLTFATTNTRLTAGDRAGLRLHVCAADLDFWSALGRTSSLAFIFVTGLSWSSGDTVTLRLSLPATTTAPGQVMGVGVAPGNAHLAVTWTAVDNATGYKVQWKSGSEDYDTGDRQATVAPGSTTRHTIDSLTNGTEYTVRVIATRTGANDGPPSAEVTGTPTAEPIPVPALPVAGAIALGLLLLGTGSRRLGGPRWAGCAGRGRTARRPPAGPRGRAGRRLARRAAWRERPRKICGQKDTPTADGHVLVAAPAGYFAAFFLRSAQEAVIRSETAFFSSAVIGRRFLVGLASDAVSATGVAAAAGRREEERRAAGFAGAEVPSILSTSFNALISACRRSISLWRSAIAFAITLMSFPRGCIVRRSTRSRLRPSVFQWVPILAQREFGGQTEPAQPTLPFPTTRSRPPVWPAAARVGPSEHQSCDRPPPAMRRAQRMDSSRHFSIARGSRNMTVGEGAGAAGRSGACCQSSSPVSSVTPVRSRCTPIQGGAAGAAWTTARGCFPAVPRAARYSRNVLGLLSGAGSAGAVSSWSSPCWSIITVRLPGGVSSSPLGS